MDARQATSRGSNCTAPTARHAGAPAVIRHCLSRRPRPDDILQRSQRAYETSLTTALDQAAAQASCGWIVDLRHNTGGTMWPMVNRLHALLGNAALGSPVDAAGKQSPWRARSAQRSTASPDGLQTDRPVAVLIGPRTASAGEMVAISFRGRANTRSFGQPSASQTTGNRSVELPGGGVLAIASTYTQDRSGHRIDGRLQPDVVLDPQAEAAEAAAHWLRLQGCVPSKESLVSERSAGGVSHRCNSKKFACFRNSSTFGIHANVAADHASVRRLDRHATIAMAMAARDAARIRHRRRIAGWAHASRVLAQLTGCDVAP
ncbi:S41 family peptidase [Xanthomonas populi]